MTASLIGDDIQVPLTVSSWQSTLSASLQSVHGQNAWWFQAWNPEQQQAQLTVQPVSRKVFDEVLGLLQSWCESNRILRFFWPERDMNWSVTVGNATATLKPDTPVPQISLRLQLLSSWLSSENTAVLPSGDNLSMIAGRMVHESVDQLTASAASQSTGGMVQSADAWSVAYHGKDCTITVETGPHKGTVLRNVPVSQAAQYLSQGYSPLAFQALQELSRENTTAKAEATKTQSDIWHETLGDIISQWF